MGSKTPIRLRFLVGVFILAGCGERGGGDDRTALRMSGHDLSFGEFQSELTRLVPGPVDPAERDSVVLSFANGYLDKIVMAWEATHHPRGDTTGVHRRIQHRRLEIIRSLYREDQLKDLDLSPEKMNRIFGWLGEEVSVRHVMVASKEEAENVYGEIKKGLTFEEAVTKYSIDQFSKTAGGQLDWFTYGEIAGLDDAAFPLQVGEISPPVWSRRGWHVLRLEARRPRERDSAEQPQYFANHYATLLREQRWQEFLDTYWRKLKVEWNEPGYDLALTLQTDYRDRYLEKMREAMKLRDEGKTLDESFFKFPRGPEPTAEQGERIVATVGGQPYRVRDAADDLWMTPLDVRPDFTQPHTYRAWIQEKMTERALAYNAESSGFLNDPQRARRVRDAVEYEWVELLYNHEVHRKAQPSPEELQAFYDKYVAQGFYHRPSLLDLCVVSVDDAPSANRVAELLGAGASSADVQAAVPTASVVDRTGFKETFEAWAGLDEAVRGGADTVGRVVAPFESAERMVVARIEARQDGPPLTFDEARNLLLRDCSAALREERARALLDSLRTAFRAEVVEEVVLSAQLSATTASTAGAKETS
jgi:parvulin-like peptidyl-prolyl isomerase